MLNMESCCDKVQLPCLLTYLSAFVRRGELNMVLPHLWINMSRFIYVRYYFTESASCLARLLIHANYPRIYGTLLATSCTYGEIILTVTLTCPYDLQAVYYSIKYDYCERYNESNYTFKRPTIITFDCQH